MKPSERNSDIRNAVKEAGLCLWQVAEIYGLTDSNFSRLLRKELDQNTRERILSIVQQLKREAS